jgi:hypothetical protein
MAQDHHRQPTQPIQKSLYPPQLHDEPNANRSSNNSTLEPTVSQKDHLAPFLQRLSDQRCVHVLHDGVLVRQPTAESAFCALGSSGLGLNAGNPVGWVTRAYLD